MDMSKENNLRFNFIESVVRWEGQINATHLATKFQLSRQAASTVLQLYRESFPQNLLYNQSNKAFIATPEFNENAQLTDFSDYLIAVSNSPQSTKDLKPSVDVVIEADPRFNDQQKWIIEQDFQMENGQKTITTRAALVNYLLRRLHIDSYKNTPEKQQIVLTRASRKSITPYLP